MHYLRVWLTVNQADQVDRIATLLAEAGRLSRQEPGCERFEVYHSATDPRCFLLVEDWVDEAAWQAHRRAQAFTEIYQPLVLPHVTRQPHVCQLLS